MTNGKEEKSAGWGEKVMLERKGEIENPLSCLF